MFLPLKCGVAAFIGKGKISWLLIWRKGKFGSSMLLWCFRFLRAAFYISQTPLSVQHSMQHRAQVPNDSSGKLQWVKFPIIYLCRNGDIHSFIICYAEFLLCV
jgi:hypothetical protein